MPWACWHKPAALDSTKVHSSPGWSPKALLGLPYDPVLGSNSEHPGSSRKSLLFLDLASKFTYHFNHHSTQIQGGWCTSHLFEIKFSKSYFKSMFGVLWWLTGLSIWCCHAAEAGIPSLVPGTSTCLVIQIKERKKKKKRKKKHVGWEIVVCHIPL